MLEEIIPHDDEAVRSLFADWTNNHYRSIGEIFVAAVMNTLSGSLELQGENEFAGTFSWKAVGPQRDLHCSFQPNA